MYLRRILGLALILCVARGASAKDTKTQARELYDSGTTHYNLREYKSALDDFTGAYRLFHEPVFLFNIAQCYRQLGEPESAASFYRAYRREAPNVVNRDELERLIGAMDREVSAIHAREPPTGTRPPQEGRSTEPPTVMKPAAPAATVAPATTVEQPTVVAQPIAVPTTGPRPRPLVKRPWLWATVATGAAVVAAGIALSVIYGRPQDPTPTLGRIGGP